MDSQCIIAYLYGGATEGICFLGFCWPIRPVTTFPISEFFYKLIRFLLNSSDIRQIFLLSYGMSQADSAIQTKYNFKLSLSVHCETPCINKNRKKIIHFKQIDCCCLRTLQLGNFGKTQIGSVWLLKCKIPYSIVMKTWKCWRYLNLMISFWKLHKMLRRKSYALLSKKILFEEGVNKEDSFGRQNS